MGSEIKRRQLLLYKPLQVFHVRPVTVVVLLRAEEEAFGGREQVVAVVRCEAVKSGPEFFQVLAGQGDISAVLHLPGVGINPVEQGVELAVIPDGFVLLPAGGGLLWFQPDV